MTLLEILKSIIQWFIELFSTSLKPATNLICERIGEYNNMERYKFSWSPSTSKSAVWQDVVITYGGFSYNVTATPFAMATSSVTYDVPSGVNVGWVVKTYNADKSLSCPTDIIQFTSYIKPPDPLTPATALTASWMQTV